MLVTGAELLVIALLAAPVSTTSIFAHQPHQCRRTQLRDNLKPQVQPRHHSPGGDHIALVDKDLIRRQMVTLETAAGMPAPTPSGW